MWRYFKYIHGKGMLDDIYRWPDNGQTFLEQDDDDVYRFLPDRGWDNGRKADLLFEMYEGWFSPQKDEITEAEAIVTIAKIVAEAEAKKTKDPSSGNSSN